jgi:hypothetical protein
MTKGEMTKSKVKKTKGNGRQRIMKGEVVRHAFL